MHFLAKGIQSAAGSRQGRKRKWCAIRRHQRWELLSIRAEQCWQFHLGSLSRPNGFESNVKRETKFQNSAFVDANKGGPIDVTGCRMFGLHQDGVAVSLCLEKSDQIFSRSVVLPHLGG